MWKVLHHWGLPLFGCVVWWGMLIALMTCWAVQGHPRYDFVSKDKNILFISDVGATNLQPIFIACASTEALCFVLTLLSERYLRHAGRLLPNWRRAEKILAGISITLGVIGQLAIIMVACFNTHIFSKVHMSMLCVFLVGTGGSALFTVAEFAVLDRSYTRVNRLRISYGLKLLWFVVALVLTICFAVLSLNGNKNTAAVFEWCLAFSFGFYLLTLVYDLAPAAKTKKGELLEQKLGNQLTRVASWVPGMSFSDNEPSMNPAAEMRENYSSHLGDAVLQHRQSTSIGGPQHSPIDVV